MFTSSFSPFPKRRAPAAWLWVLVLSFMSLPAFAIDKENRGFGLDRTFGVTGAYGFGSRQGVSGQSFLVRAEGAGYWMQTPMNNRGGMEGGMELGYDGFDRDTSALMEGFLWDFWLGFPVTLFEKRDDGETLLTSAIAPGIGLSSQHAYVYIKGKIAARIVPKVAMELSYQWTPYTGSVIWGNQFGKHAGIALAMLRYTTFFSVSDDVSLMAYLDWRQSNVDDPRGGSGDAALQNFSGGIYESSAFLPITRTRWDNNFRVGFGVAF